VAVRVVKCLNCGRSNRVPAARPGIPHCGVCGAPLPWPAESSETDFHAVVEEAAIPVLVDFWAPWCAPCRIVSPIVERMADELPGRLKMVKVNSDNAPGLSSRFGIRGIPTLILFDHGKVVDRVTGALPADALRKWVSDHLPPAAQPSGTTTAQSGPN
jgi:thioredoxin 2